MKFSTETKKRIIQLLTKFIEGDFTDIINKNWGVCNNIKNYFNGKDYHLFESLLEKFIPKYSLYSGFLSYPIPSGISGISAKHIYDHDVDKWDYTTPYGQNRRLFMIEFVDFLEKNG